MIECPEIPQLHQTFTATDINQSDGYRMMCRRLLVREPMKCQKRTIRLQSKLAAKRRRDGLNCQALLVSNVLVTTFSKLSKDILGCALTEALPFAEAGDYPLDLSCDA